MAEAMPVAGMYEDSEAGGTGSQFQLPWEDKLQEARLYKQAGNEEYKAGNVKRAIGKYHRALLYLRGINKSQEDVPFLEKKHKSDIPIKIQEDIAQLSAQCYNNLSACLLQMEDPNYEKVKQYCDDVLKVNPNDVKALYRRGVAAYHLKCPDDALTFLRHASHEPDGKKDPKIKKYIHLCEDAVAEQERLMQNTYKAMFSS